MSNLGVNENMFPRNHPTDQAIKKLDTKKGGKLKEVAINAMPPYPPPNSLTEMKSSRFSVPVSKLKTEISHAISTIDFNKGISASEIKSLVGNVNYATYEELTALNDILQAGPGYATEMFKGAHFYIDDDGALYEKWKNLGAIERISSHHKDSNDLQYEIVGPLSHAILFGKTKDGQTWVQLENTPLSAETVNGKISNIVGHTFDFIEHRLSNVNVGPYGTSMHKDTNPVKLKPKGDEE